MKVYEMKPNEIGEAVETADAIVVTLHEPNEKGRILIISRKDMVVSSVKLDSIKITDSPTEKNLGNERGEMVKRDGNHIIYKNVHDEFRHAKTNDEMMDVIKKFYPLYKPSSRQTMIHLYKRAVANGVVSVPLKVISMTHKKITAKKRLANMKYLPIKEKAGLGKSLNDSVSLSVYKRYQTRLYNNVMADVMSRVNSAIEDKVDNDWFVGTFKGICGTHNINYTQRVHNAFMMWLKGHGLVSSKRRVDRKMVYTIHRKPEIPQTIQT